MPERLDGFIDDIDLGRCDEVRPADCFGEKEVHLKPGEGNIDFGHVFKRIERTGFRGHYMNAFGTLQDLVEARDDLAAWAQKAGAA